MKKYHLSIALLAIAFHTKGQFNTTATANVATTNARYVWAGNVGVGTAQNVVPSEKLHVIGTIMSPQSLRLGTLRDGDTDDEVYCKEGERDRPSHITRMRTVGWGRT
jgi:hypothetical protein